MADARVEKLAQILVDHSAEIKPGDRVAIEATTAAQPLVRALCAAILERGGYPHLLLELPDQDEILFAHAKDEQLDAIPTFRKLAYEQFESRIRIASATNPRALSSVDPARQKRRQKALASILETQMRRGADRSFKWVSTLFPTEGYAIEAGDEPERFRRLCLPRLPRRPGRPGGVLEQGGNQTTEDRRPDRGTRPGGPARPQRGPEPVHQGTQVPERRREGQHAGWRGLQRPGRGFASTASCASPILPSTAACWWRAWN